VACLIQEGKSTKEIVDWTGYSANTVINYRNRIRKKLGLTDGKKPHLKDYLVSERKVMVFEICLFADDCSINYYHSNP